MCRPVQSVRWFIRLSRPLHSSYFNITFLSLPTLLSFPPLLPPFSHSSVSLANQPAIDTMAMLPNLSKGKSLPLLLPKLEHSLHLPTSRLSVTPSITKITRAVYRNAAWCPGTIHARTGAREHTHYDSELKVAFSLDVCSITSGNILMKHDTESFYEKCVQ